MQETEESVAGVAFDEYTSRYDTLRFLSASDSRTCFSDFEDAWRVGLDKATWSNPWVNSTSLTN